MPHAMMPLSHFRDPDCYLHPPPVYCRQYRDYHDRLDKGLGIQMETEG